MSLDRTSVSMKDLKEQPDSRYVAIVGGVEGGAIAIDAYEIQDGIFQGYIFTDTPDETTKLIGRYHCLRVISFPSNGGFIVIRRDRAELQTNEQVLRRVHADQDRVKVLEAELHPTGGKILPFRNRGELGHDPEPDDAHPGQYL